MAIEAGISYFPAYIIVQLEVSSELLFLTFGKSYLEEMWLRWEETKTNPLYVHHLEIHFKSLLFFGMLVAVALNSIAFLHVHLWRQQPARPGLGYFPKGMVEECNPFAQRA